LMSMILPRPPEFSGSFSKDGTCLMQLLHDCRLLFNVFQQTDSLEFMFYYWMSMN
jgi:hypothetical protein